MAGVAGWCGWLGSGQGKQLVPDDKTISSQRKGSPRPNVRCSGAEVKTTPES